VDRLLHDVDIFLFGLTNSSVIASLLDEIRCICASSAFASRLVSKDSFSRLIFSQILPLIDPAIRIRRLSDYACSQRNDINGITQIELIFYFFLNEDSSILTLFAQ